MQPGSDFSTLHQPCCHHKQMTDGVFCVWILLADFTFLWGSPGGFHAGVAHSFFVTFQYMDTYSVLTHSAADGHCGHFQSVMTLCKASTNIPIKSLWGNMFYFLRLQDDYMFDIPGTLQTVCQTLPLYICSHSESSSCPHIWQNLLLFINFPILIQNQFYIYRKGQIQDLVHPVASCPH